MERDREIQNYNHSFSIVERKNVTISGIKKIDSFDSEEFLIESVMGYIVLKGVGLELIKLDTMSGIVTIKGLVNSINYVDDNVNKKQKENSVFSRLFKWL